MSVHRAGVPQNDLTQCCTDCGLILQDYRNAAVVGQFVPHWWEAGESVEVVTGGTVMTVAAPDCEPDPASPEGMLLAIFEEALSKMTHEQAEAAVRRALASKPKARV